MAENAKGTPKGTPKGTKVEITGADGAFSAYCIGEGPAVVVIQEIFGVNKSMRAVGGWLAAQGFRALIPDLFWRLEAGIELDDQQPEDLQKAFDLFGRFDIDKGVQDIGASIDFARRRHGGKIGAIGYCLGGRLAYLTAARLKADAAAGYYAVALETMLDEAANIACPLLLHMAEEDNFVPKPEQAKIAASLKDQQKVEIFSYAGVGHGFARPGGGEFNQAAAELANSRTLAHLRRYLT